MEAQILAMNLTCEARENNLGDSLLRFDKNQKFLLFDTETCNLNLVSKKNVPWEWAWMLCTQREILERKEYLVQWPKIDISDEAARMTGFYQKQHKIPLIGKSPEFVISEFDKLLYDESIIPVAHNGLGFDVYIHNIHRQLTGRTTDYSYIPRFLDTNAIARANKLNIPFPKDRSQLTAFQYKIYGHRVRGIKSNIKALCEDYLISYDPLRAHEALYDVELLQQILFKLIQEVEI